MTDSDLDSSFSSWTQVKRARAAPTNRMALAVLCKRRQAPRGCIRRLHWLNSARLITSQTSQISGSGGGGHFGRGSRTGGPSPSLLSWRGLARGYARHAAGALGPSRTRHGSRRRPHRECRPGYGVQSLAPPQFGSAAPTSRSTSRPGSPTATLVASLHPPP